MAVKERKHPNKAESSKNEGQTKQRNTATKNLLGQIEAIVEGLEPSEIEAMDKAINKVLDTSNVSEQEYALARKLTGRQYSPHESACLEIISLTRYFEKREQLLQNSLTANAVANLLRTTRQTPHDRVKKKSLLAVKDNGVWKFPVWQFDPSGSDGVIDGLPAVLKALEGSEFTKLNWLTSPNPYLNNLTPVEALKKGQKAKVLKEAIALGAW